MELFSWWYGRGWIQQVQNLRQQLVRVAQIFSVPILMRTLFAPWRRIITYPGAGLDERLRAFGDNLISRSVGFVVRLLVLITAGVLLFFTGLFMVIELIVWPLLPLAVIAAIVKGITG